MDRIVNIQVERIRLFIQIDDRVTVFSSPPDYAQRKSGEQRIALELPDTAAGVVVYIF